MAAADDTLKPTAPPLADKLPGVITSYESEDRLGQVQLQDGRAVEFGRSACLGFEPFVGLSVGVGDIFTDAAGALSARVVTLATHPVKDTRQLTPLSSAETMTPGPGPFGAVTVLLEAPLPTEPEALRGVLSGPGLEKLRVVSRPRAGGLPGAELELLIDGHHMLALVVPEPFAPSALDRRQLPPGFPLGSARFSLAPTVADPLRMRAVLGKEYPDAWAPKGVLRTASRVLLALLRHGGTGVVLHGAGGLVFTREDFVRRLGDVEDARCRPFGAWLDWALDETRTRYRSFGMEVLGGQDVEIALERAHADVELDSAESAVLYACMLQVRENRLLQDGEILYVQKDIRVGPFGASAQSNTAYKYSVHAHGKTVELLRA